MNHELWRDLLIPKLLKHDSDDHEILDVVRSNDEASRWYFLHCSGGDGGGCGLVRLCEVKVIGITPQLSDRSRPKFCGCGHDTFEREATKPGTAGKVLTRARRF